jgi:saccharopine dehydrogenase-like NADP-dependent oxidoreductase
VDLNKLINWARDGMHHVMVVGAGKIGSLIACLLMESQDYQIYLADHDFSTQDVTRLLVRFPKIKTVVLDVSDQAILTTYLKKHPVDAVISSLPYFLNTHVALAAKHAGVHYFDLTEDTSVSQSVHDIAKGAPVAFVPQCGLAPGFISIAAHSLIQAFDTCHTAKLRVGAIPQCTSNALYYSLTWSTDGLINEYGNPCYGIQDGLPAVFTPLEGLESIHLEGIHYEAFNTSGGLGHLPSVLQGKVKNLNYKTIRYPGHCEKIRFLMDTLKLNDDRQTLKRILERAMPKTYQDMVLIYVSVEGMKHGELIEESYFKVIKPSMIAGLSWSAIQVSTASGVCAVVDLVLSQSHAFQGLVLQENFRLTDVLANRFGRNYA